MVNRRLSDKGRVVPRQSGPRSRFEFQKALLSELRQLVNEDLVKVDLHDCVDHLGKPGRFEQSVLKQLALTVGVTFGMITINPACNSAAPSACGNRARCW